MINREEIAKNVQRLLQGYADSSNDIKITTRTPKEADVYLISAKEKNFSGYYLTTPDCCRTGSKSSLHPAPIAN